MQTASNLGAQELTPFFSSPLYTIMATLAVTALVLLLMSVVPRLVALLFRRLPPDWIDGATTLLMVILLLGQVTIMLRWLWPNLPYLWPLLLLLTIGIAAFLPANPVSDGVAYWRLRRAAPFQLWDTITVGAQQGQVAAMRPLYTELISPTAERVRVPNSIVLRRALVVHSQAQPATTITTAPATPSPKQSLVSVTTGQIQSVTPGAAVAPPEAKLEIMEPPIATATVAQPLAESASAPAAINPLVRPLTAGTVPPLRKRQGLGATSIKGLIRT